MSTTEKVVLSKRASAVIARICVDALRRAGVQAVIEGPVDPKDPDGPKRLIQL